MQIVKKSGGSKKKFSFEGGAWEKKICLEAFGVKIGIRSNVGVYIDAFEAMLPDILPNGWRETPESEIENWFSIFQPDARSKRVEFYKNAGLLAKRKFEVEQLDFLVSSLRLLIAEYAPRHVFLHAGVVAYRNRAIIIPGRSFTGKTTLVAALIKRGCQYYSDEYAVINEEGLVEPYAKKLSLRGIIDAYRQVDVPAVELGGETGAANIPVGTVLITEYKENARVKFQTASAGEGMIGLIANSVSIRENPQFVLQVLTPIANGARVIKTKRGAAEKFAERLLEHLDGKASPGRKKSMESDV